MAGRMPVGQVWIRVSPDTRGFAAETRRELKKMKSLDRYKVPIEVEVDTQQIESDFADAVHILQKRASTEAYRVKIQTELDWKASDARRQIRKQVEAYQVLADDQKVKVKTSLDGDSVAGGGAYSPTVTLDVDERKFKRDVEKLMGETQASMTVKVDKKSSRREMEEAVDDVGKFLKNLLDRKSNVMELEVVAKDYEEAQEKLAQMRHEYDSITETLNASRKELNRTTSEYGRIRSQIAKIQYAMEKINVETEEGVEEYDALESKLGKLTQRLKAYGDERKRLMEQGRKSYLKIEADMESMAKAEADVEELRQRLDTIGAEVQVSTDKTSFAAASAEIWSLTRPRIANIYANVRRSPAWNKFWSNANSSAEKLNGSLAKYASQVVGLRLMYKTMADMVRIVPRLDMMIPALAAGSVAAISAISAASVALTTGIGMIADMMRVFNLLLAAPAAAAALGLQAWMVVEAYKKFEQYVPEIEEDLIALGDVIGDKVWEGAVDNIKALHQALMPLLNLHMPKWAKAVGENIGALADGFRKATKAGAVDEFFKNAIKGSENAKKGFEGLGSALLRLVGVGSRVLPQLGTWFSDIMTDFDQWVQKNDANGNLDRWIKEGAQSLRDLGSIVMSTISIFQSFAGVARDLDLPSLTDFARGMASFADKLAAPGGMDGFAGPLSQMVDFVREFGRVGDDAALALENFWKLAGNVASELKGPLVGAVEAVLRAFNSDKFQGGMMSFFEDIGVFIEDITPGLESLVGEFGSMAEIVGEAAKAWGPALNETFLLFEDLGKGMHPGLADFLQNVGPKLEDLVKRLRPEVEELGDAIGAFLGDDDVQEFVGYMLDALGDILTLAIDAGTGLLNAFKGFANWWADQPEWFKSLTTHLAVIAGAALPAATGLMAIYRVFKPLIWLGGIIVSVFKGLGKALSWLGGKLKKTKIGKFFKSLADDIGLRALYLWDKIKGLGPKLGKALQSLGKGLGSIAKGVGRALGTAGKWIGSGLRWIADEVILRAASLWNGLKGLGTRLGGALKNIGGTVGRAIGALVGTLKNLGSRLGGALKGLLGKIKLPTLKGIGSGLSKLLTPIWNFVKQIPGQLAKILPKGGLLKLVGKALLRFIPVVGWILLAKDILNLIKPVSVLDWIEGILRGLGLDGIADIIGGIKDNISRIFGKDVGLIDLFNPITNALRKAWDGMIKGWKSGGFWGAVKGFFSGFVDGLTDSFELLWANLKDGINRAMAWLDSQLASWNPTTEEGKFMKDLLERLPGLLGLNEDGTFSWDTLVKSWKEFGSELWTNHIWPWLQESWGKLVTWARQWEPLDQVMGFFEDPWGKIQEWLGIEDLVTGITNFLANPLEWGSNLWNETIWPWLQESWDALVAAVTSWGPVAAIIGFFEDPWGKIKEWLGIEGMTSGDFPTFQELVQWGTNLWNETIKPWLNTSWNSLVNSVASWGPVAAVIEFFDDPWGKIQEWLGIDDWTDGELPSIGELAQWGTNLWNEDIKPWLQESWDKLTNFIQNWTPIGWVFKFGTWVGDKIKEWLGIDEDGVDFGDFSIDFDFSDVWENKIKPALKNGLIALGALIAAPGLILVAPLAMPALIIGWLLGRDEEGNWSFQELTSKIEGAWNKIKEAITTGVETIIGLVGGIVMTPVAIGTKMADWILGSDWVEKAKSGITTAIENAGPALQGAVEKGVETVERGMTGGQKAGAKAGGALRRVLGIDDKGKGQIDLDFNTVGEWVQRFGDKARDEYGTTADSTSGSMDKMRNSTKSRFSDLAKHALAKAKGMRSGVGSDFSSMSGNAATKAAKMQAVVAQKMSLMQTKATVQSAKMRASVVQKMGLMQTQSGVKMVAMQRAIVQAMTRANLLGVRQAKTMSAAYVFAIKQLYTGSIRVVSALRGALPRMLLINATGPGRSTGSTYVSGLASGLSRAVSIARSMASRIRGALRFSAYSSGSSVGGTFASGIRARIGSVSSAASALARAARAKMPNSPAEEGPFSGSGWGGWGESIAEELARGLRKGAPEVAREAVRMMEGVNDALDTRSGVGIDASVTRDRALRAMSLRDGGTNDAGTTIEVNVESRSDDPLRDGNRFGGDIAFALRGAGLA